MAMLATTLLLVAVHTAADLPPLRFGNSGSPLVYVVLGDSTAAGVGAPYEAGIAYQTAKHLGRTHQVTLHNFGVSGARFRDVLEEQLPKALAVKPDLVLISAAANDVTRLTPMDAMRRRLREMVGRLRAAHPAVRIVVTGAPDMGSPPRIPWILRPFASVRTRTVNQVVRAEAKRLNLVFAPIAERTGPLFRKDRTLFDPDRFHPNARGYATWTTVLNEAVILAMAQ